MMNARTYRRGNALMVTLIALTVLLMIVSAAIEFTGTNRTAASSKARADQLQACAVTAKRVLLSRLRTFGVQVTDLKVNNELIADSTVAGDQSTISTSHYDSNTPEPTVVKLESASMGGARKQLRDVSNTISPTTLGGSYYRVVAKCRNGINDAETEVEFTFRHGI